MIEKPIFFSQGNHRLFGVLHRPDTGVSRQAFVFCHPYAEEKLWAHRVYVAFARQLAGLGFAVLRFDFTGYGDSEGDFSDCTLEVQLSDVQRAVALVKRELPSVEDVGYFGLRLGGTIALLAAAEVGADSPVIMWEPVLDGKRFLHEVLRTNLVSQFATNGSVSITREDLIGSLKTGETVNAEGYELSYAVYEQIADISWPRVRGLTSGPTLLLQASRTAQAKPELESYSERIGADFEVVIEDPFWREIKKYYGSAPNLFSATTNWIRGKT